jgi:hypothetical protein
MLILRIIAKRRLSCIKNNYQIQHLTTQAKAKTEVTSSFKNKLPDRFPKKAKREAFVKNLCVGVFDHHFLTYPEPQDTERYI